MNVPEGLPNEGIKAYAAFRAYVEMGDNRSTGKVARELGKSRQLIQRWSSKHRWQERMAAQRLHECQHKIQATEAAVESTAILTEAARANAAHNAFMVGTRLVEVANKFIERAHDSTLSLAERKLAAETAARFYGVAKDVVVSDIPSAASGYGAAEITINVASQFGRDDSPPIKTVAEAERVIAEYEVNPEKLPCDGWNVDHPDATPIPVEEKKERTVPARMSPEEMPVADGHVQLRYRRLPFESNGPGDFEEVDPGEFEQDG